MAFYDTLKLEKGMYGTPGKSFTQILEQMDPSENYCGTNLEGLDAYQRQLKRFDIKVGGPCSDTVEKFFQATDSAALFPEYVARAVRQGMEQANALPAIVATVTNIASMDYRTLACDTMTAGLTGTAEGVALPETKIMNKSSLVSLKKRGRVLASSYEALRLHPLDLFTVMLRQIGAYIARMQLGDALDVLLKDDEGEALAADVTTTGATPVYGELLELWSKVAPYELNTMLASTATMKDLMAIQELQDATAGLNFQGTGKMITPLGANLVHTPSLKDKTIIGLDKNCTLEMVQAGGIVLDYDRLIDRQMERAAISTITGFAKIFDGAARILAYKA